MPKQILLFVVSLVSVLLIGIQAIASKKILLRKTFLDLPIFLFIIVIILSAVFSVARPDAIVAAVLYIVLGLSYFAIVNTAKTEETIFFFIACLVISAAVLGLTHILSYFKVYVLPFSFTHVTTFSPLGNLLEQALYLAAIIPIAGYFAFPLAKGKINEKSVGFLIALLILVGDLGLVIFQFFTSSNGFLILPFVTGFQIAFASISQDPARIAQGFFFGSGIGTFFMDFTRFKPVSFNAYENMWYLNFFQSSSYILELIATTGVLGIVAFLLIVAKTVIKPFKSFHNPLYLSLIVLFLEALLFPFSFIEVALLFFILSLFVAEEGIKNSTKSFDLELFLVTLRKEIFNANNGKGQVAKTSQVMPVIFAVILLVFVGLIGYYATTYTYADILFNQSLAAASANNGTLTYQKQIQAINMYPFRDNFYRTFSQTNLAIANSVLALASQKNQKPDQTEQNTIISLIQQGINAAKTATNLSPDNVLNWQNYASVYRSLINFGQGSDQYAVSGMQQSITLDPSSPQEYITLGGLYYQLQQYDNAIKAFSSAINLKPNFSNSYYNLGHAYEQKGDLTDALAQYQIVAQLVSGNKTNSDQINTEIGNLQKKIKQQGNTGTSATAATTKAPVQSATGSTQQPLSLPVTPTP